MKQVLVIYGWGLMVYFLLTLPALIVPFMYLVSAFYAIIFGTFALIVFGITYFSTTKLEYPVRIIWLTVSIPVGVAFALQMIGELSWEENVWRSGGFLLFPIVAVISGWVSLHLYRNPVRMQCRDFVTAPSESH